MQLIKRGSNWPSNYYLLLFSRRAELRWRSLLIFIGRRDGIPARREQVIIRFRDWPLFQQRTEDFFRKNHDRALNVTGIRSSYQQRRTIDRITRTHSNRKTHTLTCGPTEQVHWETEVRA